MGSWKRRRPTRLLSLTIARVLYVLTLCVVFRETDAPRYVKAFVAHIVVYGVQLATIVFLRLRLIRLNVLKRRAQGKQETGVTGEDAVSFWTISTLWGSVS